MLSKKYRVKKQRLLELSLREDISLDDIARLQANGSIKLGKARYDTGKVYYYIIPCKDSVQPRSNIKILYPDDKALYIAIKHRKYRDKTIHTTKQLQRLGYSTKRINSFHRWFKTAY